MTNSTLASCSPNLLVIRGLRVEAQSGNQWKELVHGIDLELKQGEILGLIGESGAGKSTIGLAAMGYARTGLRISGGQVLFGDVDLVRANDVQRRSLRGCSIAYVAQSAAATFNPAHRIFEQCMEVPLKSQSVSRGSAKTTITDLFRRLQMPDPDRIGDRFPHQLSGGQLQRAMAAMAMAPDPRLVIFDEPTTALDVTTQVEVLAAIRSAVKELGLAAIYISHDLAVVAQMADRIMVLRHGTLVEQGDTKELLARPKEDYTKRLVSQRQFDRMQFAAAGQGAIELNQVHASYGPFKALDDISLAVRRGETVAVVGESGSGKTTLARVVAGLHSPTSGTVKLVGETLQRSYLNRSVDELRRIQYIHQMPDTALNPQQTVGKILGRALQFYFGISGRELHDRLYRLIEMIELEPSAVLDRRPAELSGGQKQRICIARALAADPSVVICDEITSALDPLVAEEILKLLTKLQKKSGQAYLFITHDFATVRAIADRVAVMRKGKIVELGDRGAVLEHPYHPYTKLLIESTPEMDTAWLDNVLSKRAASQRENSAV